jgi:hypothetical protein
MRREDEIDLRDLLRFKSGEKLDPPTTKRLYQKGLINTADVTNMQTPLGEMELLATSITNRGKELLDRYKAG